MDVFVVHGPVAVRARINVALEARRGDGDPPVFPLDAGSATVDVARDGFVLDAQDVIAGFFGQELQRRHVLGAGAERIFGRGLQHHAHRAVRVRHRLRQNLRCVGAGLDAGANEAAPVSDRERHA